MAHACSQRQISCELINELSLLLNECVNYNLQHIDLQAGKVRDLNSQLEAQCDLNRSSDNKARRFEKDFCDLEDRLRRAESELAAAEAMRDGFRIDKERVSLNFAKFF